MKECPICGSTTFDDAAVCFGCLYRFGKDDKKLQAVAAARHVRESSPHAEAARSEHGYSFNVSVRAVADAAGATSWQCAVRQV